MHSCLDMIGAFISKPFDPNTYPKKIYPLFHPFGPSLSFLPPWPIWKHASIAYTCISIDLYCCMIWKSMLHRKKKGRGPKEKKNKTRRSRRLDRGNSMNCCKTIFQRVNGHSGQQIIFKVSIWPTNNKWSYFGKWTIKMVHFNQ